MRIFSILPLALAALVAGCATSGESPADQGLDPSKTAQLEFVKGHVKSSLFRASMERFSVCTDESCRHHKYSVFLAWTTPDSITRTAPAGPVFMKIFADAGLANMHRRCNGMVSFDVEGGHAYQLKFANSFEAERCVFTVQDKATGKFVRLHKQDY
jgi:hypothetical protein